jgi:hypothetical protein
VTDIWTPVAQEIGVPIAITISTEPVSGPGAVTRLGLSGADEVAARRSASSSGRTGSLSTGASRRSANMLGVAAYDGVRIPFAITGVWPDFIPSVGAWICGGDHLAYGAVAGWTYRALGRRSQERRSSSSSRWFARIARPTLRENSQTFTP